eukprot:GHUV01043758.1.p1 GENE.GHUV01043758.1~~GHUV01043758.1.p1  ORF type:complete len:105 (+),score=1.58 GHUV01043758.1:320-634(+)
MISIGRHQLPTVLQTAHRTLRSSRSFLLRIYSSITCTTVASNGVTAIKGCTFCHDCCCSADADIFHLAAPRGLDFHLMASLVLNNHQHDDVSRTTRCGRHSSDT